MTAKRISYRYTVDQDVELLRETLELYNQNQQKKLSIEDLLKQTLSYSEQLQFILEDKEKRTFIARRYCYIGRVDDWIVIGSPDTLENLVKKYVKHLEHDSYFELI